MAGYSVDRGQLDARVGDAIVLLRSAFDQAMTIKTFLDNHPVVDDVDPLTVKPEDGGVFGYSAEEAKLLRSLFTSLSKLPVEPLRTEGRKLTGLS